MILWVSILIGTLIAAPYAVYVIWYQLISPIECSAEKSYTTVPVSIILPTYNEETIINKKLESLKDLDYPADNLEIIVVDSSSDKTPILVESFANSVPELNVRVLREPVRSGVATAVNIGVEAANGEVIFRTDCDSYVGAQSVREAVASLQDDTIGAVMGHHTEILGDSQVESDYREIQTMNQMLESHVDSTFIVHGPCFGFRKSDFTPIHPNSLADDTEIGVSIRRKGKRIILDPEMEFTEVGVSGLRKRRRRKDRRAMGLIQMLVRSRDMLGRYGLYGKFVLPFNWWFMLITPWLMIITVLLTIITGFVWFGVGGIAFLLGFTLAIILGQRDSLGPIQPLYAVFDSNLSLAIAMIRLTFGNQNGTWEIDNESRQEFGDS